MTKVAADVQQLLGRVLEEWAMMLVEPDEKTDGSQFQETKVYQCSLGFEGVVSGTCYAFCGPGFARVLTDNLVGGDDEPSEEELRDALQELINDAAGNYLTTAFGEDIVFKLTAPKAIEVETTLVAELSKNQAYSFVADDEPILFAFKTER